MTNEKRAQRRRSSLVEENAHLRRGKSAARGVLQDDARLFERHARKKVGELTNRDAVFEVLEQCCDRHARASKDPSPAYAIGVAFHSVTG